MGPARSTVTLHETMASQVAEPALAAGHTWLYELILTIPWVLARKSAPVTPERNGIGTGRGLRIPAGEATMFCHCTPGPSRAGE